MKAVEGLSGKRIVVVGASAGIGRRAAEVMLASGADVLVAARRVPNLQSLVAGAGKGSYIQADISREEDSEALAAAAAERFGTIDVLLVTVGMNALARLDAMPAETWTALLSTNVVGVHVLIRHLMPHMDPAGMVVALSSESVHHPRFGLGAYASSKAALESAFDTWRIESAPLRFSCISIGATVPTESGSDFDPELLRTALPEWVRSGNLVAEFMPTDGLSETLVNIIATVLPWPQIGLEYAVLRSPAPVVSSLDFFTSQATGGE